MSRRVFLPDPGEEKDHGLYHEEMRALSTYNAERHRGLLHTEEYNAQMKQLQDRFDLATQD